MSKTLFITLAFVTAAAAGPALAADATHAWQVGNDSYHLTFADQDLGSASGRAVALGRVEKIAARLCRDVGVRSEEQACQDKVIHSASGSLRPVIEQALAERAPRPMLAMATVR